MQFPRLGQPTKAPPGSDEKVIVFIRRYDYGLELFHPSDEKIACLNRNAKKCRHYQDYSGRRVSLSCRALHPVKIPILAEKYIE